MVIVLACSLDRHACTHSLPPPTRLVPNVYDTCRLVLAFDCPFDVLEKRLEERSKTSDRADDNPETMKKRFDTFQEQSKPVIEQYTAQGRCHNISAEDSPDEIFERVCAVLDPILCDVQ